MDNFVKSTKRKISIESARSRVMKRKKHEGLSLSQPVPTTRQRRSLSQSIDSIPSTSQIVTADDRRSAEASELIEKTIKYLFVMDKGKQPIQRLHIIKNIFNGSRKHFPAVMGAVKKYLSEIFGYDLVELESNKYILCNQIKNSECHLEFSRDEKTQKVLLFIVLAHIFMCENNCKEGVLWDFLRELGITDGSNGNNNPFGDVKHLITETFVSQEYIEKTIVPHTDPPQFEFEWGTRAEHELTPRDVLTFVSEVYGNRPPKSWPAQYKRMIAFEKPNNSTD